MDSNLQEIYDVTFEVHMYAFYECTYLRVKFHRQWLLCEISEIGLFIYVTLEGIQLHINDIA